MAREGVWPPAGSAASARKRSAKLARGTRWRRGSSTRKRRYYLGAALRPLSRHRAILALALAALAAGCGRDIDPPAPQMRVPPRVFQRVVAELGLARAQLLPDTAAYRIRIGQILATHQITTEELREFARGYGRNEDVLLPAYQVERAWLDSLFGSGVQAGFGADSSAPMPGGVVPGAEVPDAQFPPPGQFLPPDVQVPAPAPVAMDTVVAAPPETTVVAPPDTGAGP